jgi:hypothetical protein
MTTTQTLTTGREFATTMLRNFGIGARTRRTRDGMNMVTEIIEAVERATYLEGYYGEEKIRIFRAAFAPVGGYQKHILGYRARPETCAKIQAMSPYQFVMLLADMIDAGVTNMGEAETYFGSL